MLGIIDVGGGTRDIYGAGVLDYLMDQNINADFFIGVSAGSANGSSYLAHQRGRNYKFYNEYAFRKEYMSFGNFLKTGSYLDLNYIYGTLCRAEGENPFDYNAFMDNPACFYIVSTDAFSGEPVYFEKKDMRQDHYETLMTSSCVPGINKPYVFKGKPYFDGGIGDLIPIKKALDHGCDKLIVILTRPRKAFRKPKTDVSVSKFVALKYPYTADAICRRCDVYNEELKLALSLEEEGKLLILAPDDISNMKTLTKDVTILNRLYRKGYTDALKVKDYLKNA
ncbi:MAG: patatin family protein [Lachnospiraceae bacterium]|nr:patatin family protein [Lachnospiraceae bacterium]